MRGKPTYLIPPSTGTTALLYAIWNRFGGATHLSRAYFPSIKPQNFVNWMDRGKVPLKYVIIISNKLKIPTWSLNYEDMSLMFPGEAPPWREVVNSCGINNSVVKQILFLKPPKRAA